MTYLTESHYGMDNYNIKSSLYQLIAKVNNIKKTFKIWNSKIVQRYGDENFYPFTRGNILACFKNEISLKRTITDHGFFQIIF